MVPNTVFTSYILLDSTPIDFWTACIKIFSSKYCNTLSVIFSFWASNSALIPENKSVASPTIWLSCSYKTWIRKRNVSSTVCWNCIMDPTPGTSEYILVFSVWSWLSMFKIPFFTDSKSLSNRAFSSLHASITWMICWASSDHCFYTKLVFSSVICISPCPSRAPSSSSCTLSSK